MSIIVMFENVDKELNMSLYDYIKEQYQHAVPIMVCHVTKDEYEIMQQQIKDLGMLYERQACTQPQHHIGYNKFRYMLTYDKKDNSLLLSDYEHPKKIGSYVINNDGIKFIQNGYQITNHPDPLRFTCIGGYKIYTTETYKKVLEHYDLKKYREYQIELQTQELIKLVGKSCHTCCTTCWNETGKPCEKWSYTIH